MKNRIGVIGLGVLCLGLLIGLITVNKRAGDQKTKDDESISNYSNNWWKTSADLDEQRQVATTLYKDIDSQKKAYIELSNSLLKVSTDLSQTSTNLEKTQADLKASQEEIAKRDAKIADLEAQNQALDKQTSDLSTAITNLTTQISETQRKLAASEGDKNFLEKELKRLMAEKAELERQFNDLAVLKTQVSRLKEELSIARRIEWIRQGLFASTDQKGAQKLMQGLSAPQAQTAQTKAPPKPAYDLNVEVTADGSVKVIPPVTNPPAASPPAK
jgi:chromosome segregation ATPase